MWQIQKKQIHDNTQIHDLTPPELGSGNLTSEIAPDDGSGWACESLSLLGGSVGYYLIKGKNPQKIQIQVRHHECQDKAQRFVQSILKNRST